MPEEEEEDTGPTIFEAAADEEITETHWCVFVASAKDVARLPGSSFYRPTNSPLPRLF